jgi:hypothetical protein
MVYIQYISKKITSEVMRIFADVIDEQGERKGRSVYGRMEHLGLNEMQTDVEKTSTFGV